LRDPDRDRDRDPDPDRDLDLDLDPDLDPDSDSDSDSDSDPDLDPDLDRDLAVSPHVRATFVRPSRSGRSRGGRARTSFTGGASSARGAPWNGVLVAAGSWGRIPSA
jgi:hypothetical protein